MYVTLSCRPASTFPIALRRSSQLNRCRPSSNAYMSASDSDCSICAGEYPSVTRANSSRRCGRSRSGSWAFVAK